MPGEKAEKTESKATEKPDFTPAENTGFVSSSQSVADAIEGLDVSELDINFGDQTDSADADRDESSDESTQDDDGGSSDASESEESSESSESSDDDAGESNKDGFKKGLDKVKTQRDEALEMVKSLKAENETLNEKLSSFESKLDTLINQKDANQASEEGKSESKEDTFTDKELAIAIKNYMAEDDPQGIIDVINYKVEQSQKQLKKEYEAEQRRNAEITQRKQVEWTTITKSYSPEGYDNPSVKNDADFDIRDSNSVLYKEAEAIYVKGVQKGERRYTMDGGMSNAVQDAFVRLLQAKFGQTKSAKNTQKNVNSDETEGLKNRLAKERRKNALSSGASSTEDATKSPSKPKKVDELADYIAERNKAKNERMGIPV